MNLFILYEQFAGAIVGKTTFRGETTLTVDRDAIVAVCRFLRDQEACAFEFLTDLCGLESVASDAAVRRRLPPSFLRRAGISAFRLKVFFFRRRPRRPRFRGPGLGNGRLVMRGSASILSASGSAIIRPSAASCWRTISRDNPLRKDVPSGGDGVPHEQRRARRNPEPEPGPAASKHARGPAGCPRAGRRDRRRCPSRHRLPSSRHRKTGGASHLSPDHGD